MTFSCVKLYRVHKSPVKILSFNPLFFTVLKCKNSAIFFVTNDLMFSNDAANATGLNIENVFINCVKETRESKYPGAITYLQDNKAYRASIDSFGRI